MKPLDGDESLYTRHESAVAFRLFADRREPTLTVPEQIAASLGDRILAGALAPGARILEQDLADEFRVSRGPIRDAIRILEREQLVTILPRRGAVVTGLSAEEVREIFEIRGGLHELVARRTIARRDPELLAVMRAGIARLDKLAGLRDDGGRYAETTYRLTLIAARLCGNERLYRMLSALSLQTLRYSKLGLASRERRQASVALWRQSAQALERGDTRAYVALARQRIEASGEEAARVLDAQPPAAEPRKTTRGRRTP
jgi:DNA-binding GntR family transcriptional regulator